MFPYRIPQTSSYLAGQSYPPREYQPNMLATSKARLLMTAT
jgi:hypothetical protein